MEIPSQHAPCAARTMVSTSSAWNARSPLVLRASTAFALSTGDRDRDCGAGVVVKSPIRKHLAVTVTAHRQICGGLSSVTVLDQAVLLDCNLTGWPKMAGNIPV